MSPAPPTVVPARASGRWSGFNQVSYDRCQALQCWVHLLQSKLLVKISQAVRLVARVGCESPMHVAA